MTPPPLLCVVKLVSYKLFLTGPTLYYIQCICYLIVTIPFPDFLFQHLCPGLNPWGMYTSYLEVPGWLEANCRRADNFLLSALHSPQGDETDTWYEAILPGIICTVGRSCLHGCRLKLHTCIFTFNFLSLTAQHSSETLPLLVHIPYFPVVQLSVI